uniref:NADH-ubiquinone oxidoreductase chain 3 n=1 Tax=Lepidodermella squamata TaxID=1194616 RepID=A0A0F6PZS1_9BILA|nr:NADH dehydrogenase subunit 3 [Lepidodermella squamata]AKD00053.1 NADH dehydrogenase subunit 3 [Lepidodermella squamata]
MFCVVLWLAMILTSFNSWRSREKAAPFECGFDVEQSSRSPFSIRFFVLLLLFVVFDVEVALLVPCLAVYIAGTSWLLTLSSFLFVVALGLGLFFEWADGALEWVA